MSDDHDLYSHSLKVCKCLTYNFIWFCHCHKRNPRTSAWCFPFYSNAFNAKQSNHLGKKNQNKTRKIINLPLSSSIACEFNIFAMVWVKLRLSLCLSTDCTIRFKLRIKSFGFVCKRSETKISDLLVNYRFVHNRIKIFIFFILCSSLNYQSILTIDLFFSLSFIYLQGWTWPKMGSMLFVAVFIALQFATGLANPEAKRLYDDLLSNYNRLIRPVGNNSDRLTVKMGLRLSQLIDVVSIWICFSFFLQRTYNIHYKLFANIRYIENLFRINERVNTTKSEHTSI